MAPMSVRSCGETNGRSLELCSGQQEEGGSVISCGRPPPQDPSKSNPTTRGLIVLATFRPGKKPHRWATCRLIRRRRPRTAAWFTCVPIHLMMKDTTEFGLLLRTLPTDASQTRRFGSAHSTIFSCAERSEGDRKRKQAGDDRRESTAESVCGRSQIPRTTAKGCDAAHQG